MARFQPQGRGKTPLHFLNAPAWPLRKNLGPSPEFAIGLVARDGKPKGTQDRTVPCTTANHQFAVANIMNRLDAHPLVA